MGGKPSPLPSWSANAQRSRGQKAAAILPVEENALFGADLQFRLAEIFLLVGKNGKALERLDALLQIPCHLSPGWLKIDPTFALLRRDSHSEDLLKGGR